MKKLQKKTSYYINAAISIGLMLLFRFIPPFATLTPFGMTIIGIFLGALWGWVKCNMIWPSVLAIILVGMTEYSETGIAGAITSVCNNSNVQLVILIMIIGALLTTTGCSDLIARKMIASKSLKGHPWRLSIVLVMAAFVTAALKCSFPGLFLCWEFVYVICKTTGYTKDDAWTRMMICAIPMGTIVGMTTLPISFSAIAGFGYLATASENAFAFNAGLYTLFALPFGLLIMAIFFVLLRVVVRPDMSKLKQEIDLGETAQFTRRQLFALGLLGGMIVLVFLPSLLPAEWGLTQTLTSLGTNGIILLILAIGSFVRTDEGKPYFEINTLSKSGLMWEPIFMVGAAIYVGGALSSSASGFQELCSSLFGSAFASMNPYIFLLIIAVIAAILTNILNNAIVLLLMIPIAYPFAVQTGANPLVMTVLLCFASNLGIMLPCASPTGAILSSNKEWTTTKDILLVSSLCLLAFAAACCIYIPIGNLIYS